MLLHEPVVFLRKVLPTQACLMTPRHLKTATQLWLSLTAAGPIESAAAAKNRLCAVRRHAALFFTFILVFPFLCVCGQCIKQRANSRGLSAVLDQTGWGVNLA